MQFRSDHEIRVATLSGHIAVIGPEWRDLPPALHGESIALGAEFKDDDKAGKIQKPASVKNSGVDDRDDFAKTVDAIKKMVEADEEEEFNNDGSPNVHAVSRNAGFTVSKSDVMKAWDQLQAEAAK